MWLRSRPCWHHKKSCPPNPSPLLIIPSKPASICPLFPFPTVSLSRFLSLFLLLSLPSGISSLLLSVQHFRGTLKLWNAYSGLLNAGMCTLLSNCGGQMFNYMWQAQQWGAMVYWPTKQHPALLRPPLILSPQTWEIVFLFFCFFLLVVFAKSILLEWVCWLKGRVRFETGSRLMGGSWEHLCRSVTSDKTMLISNLPFNLPFDSHVILQSKSSGGNKVSAVSD